VSPEVLLEELRLHRKLTNAAESAEQKRKMQALRKEERLRTLQQGQVRPQQTIYIVC